MSLRIESQAAFDLLHAKVNKSQQSCHVAAADV